MAFNPFESFRRNSKAMLAVLTIFIMFVFILSSGVGGGDFFDWLGRQLGGRDSRGSVMGEIEGSEYHARDLEEVRKNRAAANLFMTVASQHADFAMLSQVDQDLKNNAVRNAEFAKQLQEALEMTRSVIAPQNETERQRGGLYIQFQLYPNSIAGLAAAARSFNEKDHAPELRNLRRLEKIAAHFGLRMSRESGMFFGEIPNKDANDALAFLMILKEADKMEIKFVDDDINKMIEDETEGVLKDGKVLKAVDDSVRNSYKLSADAILKAIGDEYRMRTALGVMRGRMTTPAAQSPFEMFEYYKDRCQAIDYDIIDVSVEKYLASVTATPTEAELASMYDLYARQEFDPSKSTPGFKEPRKVKIEYVGISDALPMYRKAQAPMRAASIVAAPFQIAGGSDPFGAAFTATSPLFAEWLVARDKMQGDAVLGFRRGGNPFNPIGPPQPRMSGVSLINDALESRLWRDYIRTVFTVDSELRPHRMPPVPSLNLVETMLEQRRWELFIFPRPVDPYAMPSEPLTVSALPIASLTGQLLTASNGLGSSASAVAGLRNVSHYLDSRYRVLAGVQAVVAPIGANSGFAFTGASAALANIPALPEGYWVAAYLAKSDAKAVDRRLALRDYEHLRDRLNDIRKKLAPPEEKKDKDDLIAAPKKKDFKAKPEDVKKANEEARALVDQFVKDHTIKGEPSVHTGRSETLRDQYQISFDPGLKELRDVAMLSASSRKPIPDPRDIDTEFREFFSPPLESKDNPEARYYTPENFGHAGVSESNFNEMVYMGWRIDDVAPKQVPYDKITPEMKSQIVRAWKIRKAREMATEDAQKLTEAIQALRQKNLIDSDNMPAFKRELSDLANKSEKYMTIKPIEGLAFFTQHPSMQPNTRPTFVLPVVKHPNILYPLSLVDPNSRDNFDQWNGRQMAFQLLDMRNKPLGEAVTIKDTPDMHLYVCVMTKKTPPTTSEFYQVFRMMNAPNARAQQGMPQPRDFFYRPFLDESRDKADRDMVQRIRAHVKFKETEELKKSLEKRDGSSQ